ncbi:hypothetical protein CAB38_00720 [Xanthomonas citri pv. punicae]|nr:hypothetical protein CAB38_00720 [Xanthomonas citri pv. punicae]
MVLAMSAHLKQLPRAIFLAALRVISCPYICSTTWLKPFLSMDSMGYRLGHASRCCGIIHHRGQDVRSSDMTNLLGGLANLQSVKAISPPIFAYDAQQRILQVVDSTFYFFIKNADRDEVVESLQNPLAA